MVHAFSEQIEIALSDDFVATMRAETTLRKMLVDGDFGDALERHDVSHRVTDALLTQSCHPDRVGILARVLVKVCSAETMDGFVAALFAVVGRKVRDQRRWSINVLFALIEAGCFRQDIFETFLGLFADRDRKLAKVAWEGIARFGHRAPDFLLLAPALLLEINSPNPESRSAALSALSLAACDGTVLPQDAAAVLRSLAQSGNNEAALGMIGHNLSHGLSADEVLLHATKNGGAYVLAQIAHRFRKNRAQLVVPLVVRLLDHSELETRIAAANACRELASTADLVAVAPRLVALLCDSTYWLFGRTSPGEAAANALLVWLHHYPDHRADVMEQIRGLACESRTAKQRIKELVVTLNS